MDTGGKEGPGHTVQISDRKNRTGTISSVMSVKHQADT